MFYSNSQNNDFSWIITERGTFGQDTIIWKSGIWGCKKIKILRKIVQMRLLAMHFFFTFYLWFKIVYKASSVPNIQTPKKCLSYFFFAEETFVHVMHITDKKN